MNKKEKLEATAKKVIKTGLPPEEVTKTSDKVLPGMYVYSDGLISVDIINGRQIKAIVAYVEGSEVLAVCLREKQLRWSRDVLEAYVTRNITSGQKATKMILEIAHREKLKAEAAQYCYNYAEDSVKHGEAFFTVNYGVGEAVYQ